MSQISSRLICLAALVWAGFGPAAQAAPPKHPPLPPARPVFASDADATPVPPEGAPQAGAQPEGAPQEPQYREPQYAAQPPASPPEATPQAPAETSVAPQNVVSAAPAPARSAIEEEGVAGFALAEQAGLAKITREYARRHGIPLALLHRIIMRESRYHPHLINRRYYGLMQMTPATARSMGYHGSPQGLLDPETALRFGAPYLANAWKLADGDPDRAVRLYASGYYYTAKNRNMLGLMRTANSPPVGPTPPAPELNAMQAPPPSPSPTNFFDMVFRGPAQ